MFAEARDAARGSGTYASEGCGFVAFAADLGARQHRLNSVGNGLADIRARLARIAKAEGWEMPGNDPGDEQTNEQEGTN